MSERLAQILRQKIDEFDGSLRRRNYSPTTRKTYVHCLQSLADWVAPERQLNDLIDLTPQVMAQFWADVCSRPPRRKRKRGQQSLQASSLRLYAAAYRSFFRELVQRGELLHDPSAVIDRPRNNKSFRGELLSEKEVLKLLMAIELDTPEGFRDRAVVELLYSTGIRRAELLGLDLGELDLEEGWARILGKGDRERFVPVGHEAILALRAYLQGVRPRLALPREKALFVGPKGRRYTGHQLAELLHKLADKAGLKKRVTPHVLRHSCATHMLAGKADIRYIQVLLGHESLNTTQIYTRVELTELRQTLLNCHPRERDL